MVNEYISSQTQAKRRKVPLCLLVTQHVTQALSLVLLHRGLVAGVVGNVVQKP